MDRSSRKLAVVIAVSFLTLLGGCIVPIPIEVPKPAPVVAVPIVPVPVVRQQIIPPVIAPPVVPINTCNIFGTGCPVSGGGGGGGGDDGGGVWD